MGLERDGLSFSVAGLGMAKVGLDIFSSLSALGLLSGEGRDGKVRSSEVDEADGSV